LFFNRKAPWAQSPQDCYHPLCATLGEKPRLRRHVAKPRASIGSEFPGAATLVGLDMPCDDEPRDPSCPWATAAGPARGGC
jgi:hypothetical protein